MKDYYTTEDILCTEINILKCLFLCHVMHNIKAFPFLKIDQYTSESLDNYKYVNSVN